MSEARQVGVDDTLPATETLPANSRGAMEPLVVSRELRSLDDFEVLGELGRGGLGVVHRAQQRSLGREVALKRTHLRSEHARTELVEEARITGRLEHPNVVPIHGVLEDNDGIAVIMKRISGQPWSQLIADEGVGLERHLDIFRQVCAAVAFAHSRGVAHRDIKPDNVMIGEFDEVYLVDWGLARSLDENGEVKSTRIVGTPAYMAPEMLDGVASPRSDLFAMGAVLYELLSGRPPYQGTTVGEVLIAIAQYQSLPELPGAEHAELMSICQRACAKDPAERYESVLAFRDALQESRQHRAAAEMTSLGEQRLGELEKLAADERYAEAQETFIEARFAIDHSLRLWPDNDAARGLRERCLLRMAEIELQRDHVESAYELVQAMHSPPEELVTRIAAARRERDDDKARFAALERDRDHSVGASARRSAQQWLAVLVVLLIAGFVSLRVFLPGVLEGSARLVLVSLAVLVLGVAVVGAWRRTEPFNLINRRIAQIVLGVMVLSAAQRTMGHIAGTSVETLLRTDALLLCGGGLALVPFHSMGRWLALAAGAVALIGTFAEAWLQPMFVGLSALVAVAYLLGRRGRDRS